MVVLFKKAYLEEWEQEVYSHEYSCASYDQTPRLLRSEREQPRVIFGLPKQQRLEVCTCTQGRRMERLHVSYQLPQAVLLYSVVLATICGYKRANACSGSLQKRKKVHNR